jgi:hypothetical protein
MFVSKLWGKLLKVDVVEGRTPVIPWVAIPSKGYFVTPCAANECEYRHMVGGSHEISNAQCPNCRKPLLRLLSLDAKDPRLTLEHDGLDFIPLFLCWTCNVAQAPFYYRLAGNGSVEIVAFERGGIEADFPYEGYPVVFPERPCRLEDIPYSVQQAFEEANAGREIELGRDIRRPRHQVGGQPLVLDSYSAMRCITCQKRMAFLAAVGNDSGTEQGFVGNPYVQMLFHYCRTCQVIGVYHRTD